MELRRAIGASSWAEMRELPGITHPPQFLSPYSSKGLTLLNMRQIMLSMHMYASAPDGAVALPARAAELEAYRRLVVAALALERHRSQFGAYPPTLSALVPEFLSEAPVDFMDGKPLRYKRAENGHYVLYSTGLDVQDDGGVGRCSDRRQQVHQPPSAAPTQRGTDLVWRRPAARPKNAVVEE